MSHDSDEALMRAATDGSKNAFDELCRRHSGEIYGYIQKRVQDSDVAFDILQEIFLKLWVTRGRYDPSQPLKPWLWTITTNVLNTYFRTKTRRGKYEIRQESNFSEAEENFPQSSETQFPDPKPNPLEILLKKENREMLEEALSLLPIGQREVIMLKEIDGLSQAEIAQRLNIATGTVGSRMNRGKDELRRILTGRVVGNSV
ncbi:MAG TPA: RNA polymerase sigma factor [Blastocatellia bacterium]|nr:RNA polymerase sigma factor [Blastocatellia bacterium]